MRPVVPIVKNAQQRRQSQSFLSFRSVSSSRKLKLASAALGALMGSLAWMKAFSFSDSHFAVGGTRRQVR